MCYAIDQSGSMTDSLYEQEQDFVIQIARFIEHFSRTPPLKSAIAFSGSAKTIQAPTLDCHAFKDAVEAPRLFSDGTFISSAINLCAREMEHAEGNKIIVLLTDGMTDAADIENTLDAAKDAEKKGMKIVTIGMGDGISEDLLTDIASDPSLFINTSFESLQEKVPLVAERICDAGDTQCSKCEDAYDDCEFRFAGKLRLPTFNVTGEADMAFTTRIIPKDVSYGLGMLNSNNIIPEFIHDDGTSMEIIEFGSQRFSAHHFKPFWVAQDRGSGIGHETFHGDQEEQAKNRCVRLFFTHYQEIRQNGVVNQNNVPRSQKKCVVFRTQ